MSDKRDQNPGQDDALLLADAGRRRFLGGAAALGAGAALAGLVGEGTAQAAEAVRELEGAEIGRASCRERVFSSV